MSQNQNIYEAVINGNINTVQQYITACGDVNARQYDGGTLLIRAAVHNRHDCLQELIKAGADVNLPDVVGWTALMGAAYYGNIDCCKELIHAGGDIEAKDEDGKTALAFLCNGRGLGGDAMRYTDKEFTIAIRQLLEAGANVNIHDIDGLTPLMHLVRQYATGARFMALRRLVKYGADINAHDIDGNTALHLSIQAGEIKHTLVLLKIGADPCVKNNKGETFLDIKSPHFYDSKREDLLKKINLMHVKKSFRISAESISNNNEVMTGFDPEH